MVSVESWHREVQGNLDSKELSDKVPLFPNTYNLCALLNNLCDELLPKAKASRVICGKLIAKVGKLSVVYMV